MTEGISEVDPSNQHAASEGAAEHLASRGPQLRSIAIADAPRAWISAGFSLDNNSNVRLGNTTLALCGNGGGFRGWEFADLTLTDCSEMPTGIAVLDSPPAIDSASSDCSSHAVGAIHTNGIVSIDHVVLRTNDRVRVTDQLAAAGFPPRRTRRTTIGNTRALQTFFWAGDVIIELVGPEESQDSISDQEADLPALATASLFGLAVVSSDLDQTAAHLGPLLGTPRPAVQRGRRVATLRGQEVGISIPVLVMSQHV